MHVKLFGDKVESDSVLLQDDSSTDFINT